MKSLSKKLCVAFLAAISALCLCIGTVLLVPRTASARTVALDDARYFEISKGAVSGLSDAGEQAIAGSSYFTVKLPEGQNITEISMGAFRGNATLTEIEIPEGVTGINGYAFYGCTSLRSVKMPESLEYIGGNAFNGCSSLVSVTIPSSVADTQYFKGIETNAFLGCNRLVEVYNKSSLNIEKDSSYGGVGANALNIYTDASGSKLSERGDYLFYSDETKVPAEVYLIDYAGTDGAVNLPADYNGLSYAIYKEAFKGDSFVTEVGFPDNAKITAIGDAAFSGCTALTELTVPESVHTIGKEVFKGCTSLVNIDFGNEFSTVDSSLFEGCVSLESVNLPASVSSVQAFAFKGCTALGTVTFNKYKTTTDVTREEYLLKFIYSGAFEGCSSLKYIEIPESVTNVQSGAFAGCGSLTTVYLPAAAEFGENVFDFDCPILIAPDAASCGDYARGGLSAYEDYLTYKVEVVLDYGGENHSDYRLYNFNYKYVLTEDGKSWAEVGGMPVQEGYKTSVWYSEASYANEVDGEEFNSMLGTGGSVTLYARTVEKPALTPANNLVYTSEEITFADAFGWTDALGETCEANVTEYVPYIGTAETPGKILDAGVYTVSVTLKEQYGEWTEASSVKVTVARATADIAKFNWVSLVDNGDGTYSYPELASTDSDKPLLYLYLNDAGATIPYLDEDPSKKPAEQPKQVVTSYLFYNGNPHTLVLKEDERYGGELKVNYISGYSATQAGKYTVRAEISADNNFIFDFTNDADAIYRGLGVSGQLTGSDKVTITKTWYVVASTTNALLIGGSPYNVPSVWTYKGGALNAPDVTFGNAEELVTFTLKRKDLNASEYVTVCGSMFLSDFYNVINHSMPVGDYELIFKIKDYTSQSGTFYEGGEFTFEFSIMNTVYENADRQEIDEIIYIDGVNEVRYSPTVKFAEVSGWDLLDPKEKLHDIPADGNIWAGRDYADYYRGFEIYYYVVSKTGNSGGYFTYEDYAGNTDNKPRIIPNTVGVYTVYYTISAPGYVPVSGESYTLIVYEELSLADVQNEINSLGVAYNGEARKPNIDNDIYRAVYLDDETNAEVGLAMSELGITETCSYVNAADYPVALAIRDTHFVESYGCYLYRWEGWEENPAVMYVQVTLTVEKAENNTRTALSVPEWQWNGYNTVANAISWTTDWVTDINQFEFTLESVDGKKTYSFAEFGTADSGFYILKAVCPEGDNYKEGREDLPIFIRPAEITFKVAPYVESWKYGDFAKMYRAPQPVLDSQVSALQDEVTESAYFLRNGSTQRYLTINDLKDENGEVPYGKYTLVYARAAQGNYSVLDYRVSFQVLKADNFWDVTPVVNGWVYGDKSIDYLTYKPEYAPHFGDAKKVVIQYRALDENYNAVSGWEYTLADLGLDDYGKLNVGNYEIKASMSGAENYESMEFSMRFKVTKAQNSWDEIPNVVSWNSGRLNSVEEVLTAIPANGTVLITITDSKGKVIVEDELPENINVNKLRSLSAGSYVLKAYVASSDRFDELVAYVDFAVFEDAVSQTALIALTIVFAVIAIVLAVVGVVLLVRRDRQIEEEFRKMIKAELNRR